MNTCCPNDRGCSIGRYKWSWRTWSLCCYLNWHLLYFLKLVCASNNSALKEYNSASVNACLTACLWPAAFQKLKTCCHISGRSWQHVTISALTQAAEYAWILVNISTEKIASSFFFTFKSQFKRIQKCVFLKG